MRAARANATGQDEHISGAETICRARDIAETVALYTGRGLSHPRGPADSLVLTIEKLASRPRTIAALPLATLRSFSSESAASLVSSLLGSLGISPRAVRAAFGVISSSKTMRGAALLSASSGTRLDADRSRGVRASLLGMSPRAAASLGSRLGRLGLKNPTVTEALVLASKIASCDGVIAELCVSDDPGYTTGYVASKRHGYLRVPCIKKKGDRRGGRIIFLDSSAGPDTVAAYLETTPVLISRISACSGEKGLDEILGRHHQ